MVNFTCNTCGDSLKKKEVTTHFARKLNCRQALSLTCFDCLKIFGNDYVQHTTCVTEDQRYSSNGLKGAEKTKAQIWTESVHQHLNSVLLEKETSLPEVVKNIIKYVLNSASIPKKEKPFFNFMINLRRFQEKDIRIVWNMLKELAEKQEDQSNINGKPEKKNTLNKSNRNSNETNPGEKPRSEGLTAGKAVKETNKDEKDGKKKKKSKKTTELNEEMEGISISNDLSETKNEKKKGAKGEYTDALQTNGNSEDTHMEVEEQNGVVQSEKLSKKEKKLKKKKEKFEAELQSLETEKPHQDQPDDIEDPVVEDKEAKKKKNKKKQDVELNVDIEMDKQKKKKKRERTVSMAAETDQPPKKNKSKGSDENTEPNEDAAEDVSAGRKEFNWANVITQVLQSQNDHEMSVKRLCKKVVNEYLSSLLDGVHVDELKVTAKFQKKLHKTPGVFVHKDKAKLKLSE